MTTPLSYSSRDQYYDSGIDLVVHQEGQKISMANQLGKMYVCTKCGSQVIVTKGGAGMLKCCGVDMQKK
jgi:hypothetical protein